MPQRECMTELEFVDFVREAVNKVGSPEKFCETHGIVDVEYVRGVIVGALMPIGSLGRKLGFEKHTMFVKMKE